MLLATAFFFVGGALNLLQRATRPLPPIDGIVWRVKDAGMIAERVDPNTAGARAGILPGDKLIAVSLDGKSFDEIVSPSDIQMYLETAGVGGDLTYRFQRSSYTFSANLYDADLTNIGTRPRWTAAIFFLTLVGLVYLGVGLFVLFKQGSSVPFVLHFSALCLTAFIIHVYKPLGAGEDLDLAVSLIDDLAFAFFPALFAHFCWRYPIRTQVFFNPRWKNLLLYVPGAIIFGLTALNSLVFQLIPVPNSFAEALAVFNDRFNLTGNLYFAAYTHFIAGLLLGGGVLLYRFIRNKQAVVRQRLKWTLWGTIVAVIPALGYQIGKGVFGLPEEGWVSGVAILPLALIPLTFGHSVIRYRLMDVDMVVRRALVYAVTTLAISMMIGTIALALMFLAIGDGISNFEIALRALVAIIAMAIIVIVSEPLKNFLQERVDRFFYGERYDMRRGLLDFGRTLSATTALDPLLNALVSRLQQVLNVEKVAVFIEDEAHPDEYRIAQAAGLTEDYAVPKDFRNMIRAQAAQKSVIRADDLELSEEEREFTGAMLHPQQLHYYVPCVARGRMVAVIGLGRAIDGSLLSSEDIEILRTVSGYVAVALENSLLYQEQERRASELALLKEFNESIVESVNVGLVAVDVDGRVTRCNSTFEELFGLKRETSVGKLVEDIFDRDFADSVNNILGKSRWHLTELRNAYKLHAVTDLGEQLTLNIAIAPLRSPVGEKTGAIVMMEDVSGRLKLEEQMQQREKLSSIGLLAAGVAHEVNTPLTGVSSYTQMLLGMLPENDPKHELLKKVHRQTERASNIVNNLLNFSRAGSSGEFAELNVNKVLDDTLQLLEVQMRKSQIEIVKDYDPQIKHIYGNAGKLQQVFTNLILNSRDAMPNGGRITLVTRQTNDGVEIEVADNGSGIEPENLSKIYDPFFTTKEVGKGTGLGLAVTYGIVQEHSGEIRVTSRPGEGTTFNLILPVAQPLPEIKQFEAARA